MERPHYDDTPIVVSSFRLSLWFVGMCGAALVGLALGRLLAYSPAYDTRMPVVLVAAALPIGLALLRRLRPRAMPAWLLSGIVAACGTSLIPLLSVIAPLPSRRGDTLALIPGVVLHVIAVLGIPALVVAIVALIAAPKTPLTATPRAVATRSPAIGIAMALQALLPLSAVISATVLLAGMWLSRSLGSAAAFLAALLALPVLVSWATYGLGKQRWRLSAVPPPAPLAAVLDTTQAADERSFDDVIVTGGTFTPQAHVMFSPVGASTLILSDSVIAALTGQELFALVQHELAHVRLRHYARRWVRGVMIATVCIAVTMLLGMALHTYVSTNTAWLTAVVPVTVIGLPRYLWILSVTRTFEAEADCFAARAAGGENLISALHKLDLLFAAPRVVYPTLWTSHGSIPEREARIRECQ